MDWFSKRTEDSVRAGSRTHGLAVLDTVSELDMALEALANGKPEICSKCIERLFLSEHEADRVEDRLCVDIVGGELSFQEREDLIHFVRKMDQIANWAKESALYIQIILETGTKVPIDMWESIRGMSKEIIIAVKSLIKAVENLGGGRKDIMKHIDSVIDQERVVDCLYIQCTKKAHMDDIDAKAVMLIREVIRSLEVCADECKSVADTMNIMTISRGA